jgi:hypothetical protein
MKHLINYGVVAEAGARLMNLADPIVDVPAAAALYSQVAGLLAGFAFTALMVYLTRSPDLSGQDDGAKQRENATALSLVTTLIAFVIISVLYAILAGGPPKSGAGYLGIMIYGVAFALAILSVFHSLALLASSRPSLGPVVNLTRIWATVIGPTVSMLLLSSAALDIFFYLHGKNASTTSQLLPSQPFGFGLVLTALIAVCSTMALKVFKTRDAVAGPWISMPNTVVLLVSLLSAAGAVVLLLQKADLRPSNDLIIAILVAIFVIILTFSVVTALARPPAPETAQQSEQFTPLDQNGEAQSSESPRVTEEHRVEPESAQDLGNAEPERQNAAAVEES